MPAQPADEGAIREQAYYFWEQEGRPHGRDTEFWMRAVVAVSGHEQMETLTESPPKAAKATKTKSAAARVEAPPAKSRPAKAKRSK